MTATTEILSAPVETPARSRTVPAPIPFTRIVGVELRKMFDTRAGRWLIASIGIVAVIAQVAIIAFAPDTAITFETFGTAMGAPLAIILPIIAILSVTSEWSQRSGMTTFTLVPSRGRVILAKAICAVGLGVAASLLSLVIGALGFYVGSSVTGVARVWELSVTSTLLAGLATTLSLSMGFVLGVLFRNSAPAIVGYFVYSLVLPGLFGMLAAFQGWFADLQGWVDFNYSTTMLYDQTPSAEQWAQLGLSGTIWMLLPLAVGLWFALRSEVK